MQIQGKDIKAGMKINFWVNEGKGVIVDKLLPYNGFYGSIAFVAVLRWEYTKGWSRKIKTCIEKNTFYTLME